ncbi:MAG: peptidase [Clostridiales bacterium]|jgi:PmbA protein|nr:peptidase [Clostridiales bacterium]
MLDLIKKVLENCNDIDGWKIIEKVIKSNELFFIKKDLDMNRVKDVHHFTITVYKDFEENGVKYKGSSSTNIHPTMRESEIMLSVESAAFGAKFIKNQYYPLVKPTNMVQPKLKSNLSEKAMVEWLPETTDAIFSGDEYKKGWINSAELFINHVDTRIVNSEGVDISYNNYKGELEFITNWKEESEEIELYKDIKFANFDSEWFTQNVEEMLSISMGRAKAKPMPNLGKHTVLLTGEGARSLLDFYNTQASVKLVFEGISTAKLGESIQGENITGDVINMKLDPFIENSSESAAYDNDGLPLSKVNLIENGVLKSYWGNTQYSHYMNVKPTGSIKNIVVDGGKKSLAAFKTEPYIELISFSNFQMDPFTGDFGGEVRLGWYYDGEKTIPVTGGAVTGNIKDVQHEMYLSKELQVDNDFIGPRTIQLFNVSVSGKE